ncbi:MAG: TerD family protein [Desulfuromonadales bacterium]
MEFIRGQKSKLSDLTNQFQLEVGITIASAPGQVIDISCFGLDANEKLSDDRYMIFYNQKTSPCGSLATIGSKNGSTETFKINLSTLPPNIRKLVFTATIDGTFNMSSIGQSSLCLFEGTREIAYFKFSGKDFLQEVAIIIGELYLKDVWRFAANGQGFNGGLGALLKHFGGEEAPSSSPSVTPVPASPQPAPAPPAPPKVSLSKVSLDKRGSSQSVNLKKSGGTQRIHVNLNWDQPKAKGFFSLSSNTVDLDLGCMYRMTDGTIGVIQPLGNSFGSKSQSPYIYLDKDDRTGSSSDGENLYILRPDMINLVVIFAMIYEGSANFSTVNGRLTIVDDGGLEICIPLNAPDSKNTFCAIAKVEKVNDSINIIKEEKYFPSHKECDNNYGFGFRWVAGQK